MSEVFDKILLLLDEIFEIATNKRWAYYSERRTEILLSQKIYELKDILSEIPMDFNINSKASSDYFEKILGKITEIMNNMTPSDLLFPWYEIEIFRLNFATFYANMWGQAGELSIAGTANALANALLGIQTLNVDDLYVPWGHHQFHKRRVIILNYLDSAMGFFFTLVNTLDVVYKHDVEHWLTEALKACEQYLYYSDLFWDIPKNVALEKKRRLNASKPNYSMYYALFFGIDEIINNFLISQKFFFDREINVENETFAVKTPEDFWKTVYKILDKLDFYISDLKEHAEKKTFGYNESPLEDETVLESLYQLDLTKVYVKGFYSLYKFFKEGDVNILNSLRETVFINFFNFLQRYKEMMDQPDFINSQLADGVSFLLEELIPWSGLIALKLNDYSLLEEVEKKFAYVFSETGKDRYPTMNGLRILVRLTLDISKDKTDRLKEYAKDLIYVSKKASFEPRNSFAFALLGYLLSLVIGTISIKQFKQTISEVFEDLYASLGHQHSDEIEIYLYNLFLAFDNEKPSYNMSRLLAPKYYDPYTYFVPDLNKIAKYIEKDIIYLPFNLESDSIIHAEHSMIEEPETYVKTTELLEKKEELQDTEVLIEPKLDKEEK
ncbi:MAG: hypothetical protein K9W46_01260 [Candidatus Heimdallarchaeum endolithica]|uniref:Uncharacterized protein n=1 Tax=Candidatus Heimdallarchaeum endolithica TaxID=2876572 RepID=A0A9Y1FPM0_9ARCH|nr:MAG: hypothetical protein K9W46_01260 [Candidatus Heimdallarchaeum endolithica]